MELANSDNILRLLVRNATPQEDINYYDMASELQVWLKWLQGTTLLTILPPRKVPASYWARFQSKKRKSSEFQPYFICPYKECPNAGEPFLM